MPRWVVLLLLFGWWAREDTKIRAILCARCLRFYLGELTGGVLVVQVVSCDGVVDPLLYLAPGVTDQTDVPADERSYCSHQAAGEISAGAGSKSNFGESRVRGTQATIDAARAWQ